MATEPEPAIEPRYHSTEQLADLARALWSAASQLKREPTDANNDALLDAIIDLASAVLETEAHQKQQLRKILTAARGMYPEQWDDDAARQLLADVEALDADGDREFLLHLTHDHVGEEIDLDERAEEAVFLDGLDERTADERGAR